MSRRVTGSYKKFRKKYLQAKNKEGTQHCYICGVELDFNVHPVINTSATIDHIIPLSKGGKLKDLNNIALCCYKCNCSKGDTI